MRPLAQCAPGRTRTLNATRPEAKEVPWAWQHTRRHRKLQQPLVIWDQSWYLSKAAGVLEVFVNPWGLGPFPTLCHLWFSWKFTRFPAPIAAGIFLHYTWGMSAFLGNTFKRAWFSHLHPYSPRKIHLWKHVEMGYNRTTSFLFLKLQVFSI